MRLTIGPVRSNTLVCGRQDCFNHALVWIEGTPYCESCSKEVINDYGEPDEITKVNLLINRANMKRTEVK
jgi:hypothetical protein